MTTAEKTKPKDVTQATFQPHLLAVLAELSNWKAGEVVYFKDTYQPIFNRMGITEDEYGDQTGRAGRPWTHQLIGLAFRNARLNDLAEQSGGKGRWSLTNKGIEQAREILKKEGTDVPDAPKQEATKDIDDLLAESHAAAAQAQERREKDQKIAQAAAPATEAELTEESPEPQGEPSNVVELRTPDTRFYHEDPYIRSLAIQATSCFGWYSDQTRVCSGCPLASECADQLRKTYADVAAEIKKEEREAALAAERAAAKKVAAEKSKATDELVSELEEARQQDKATQKRDKNWDRSKAMTIRARANSKCRACKETIPNGEEVFWIEGVGTFHKGCL